MTASPQYLRVDSETEYIHRAVIEFAEPVSRADAARVVRSQDENDWLVEMTRWKHTETGLLVRSLTLVRAKISLTASQKKEGGKGGVSSKSVQNAQTAPVRGALEKPTAVSSSTAASAVLQEQLQNVLDFFSARSARKITPRDHDLVTELLGHFSAQQLCEALEVGLAAEPTKKISSVLRNAKTVRRILKLPEPPFVTWLTPFAEVWTARYGGAIPAGVASKVLKPLVDTHGAAAVVAEFTAYVGQTDINYTSLPKFASGFGGWRAGKSDRRAVDLLPSDTPSKTMVF